MPYHLIAPSQMPPDGFRRLTLRELGQRAQAMACIRDKDPAQCQGQVYVSLFFDGTGNNMDWEDPELGGVKHVDANKHSNVARLYNARHNKPEDGFFSYYIPGVGTPFKEIGDTGKINRFLGRAAGYMGADRINWGILQILNAVHRYQTGEALLEDELAGNIANNASKYFFNFGLEGPYRRMVLTTWEEKLAEVLRRHQRKVTQISVAVFGFSRGAAMARAFSNWLCQLLKQEGGGYRLAGVPLRISFMGLFDTVASVGMADSVPGSDGHMAWADGFMEIPPAVEQCVHFVALHEQRASFPLEMTKHVKQVAYPGMHSDVGGGYLPGEQGKSMPAWGQSPQLSQIPLIDMYHAAWKGGVPLKSIGEIKASPSLSKDFDCPVDLIEAVNAYYQTCGLPLSASGKDAVQAVLRAHTQQYLRWRATCVTPVRAYEHRRFYQQAVQGEDLARLKAGLADFAEHLDQTRIRMAVEDQTPAHLRAVDLHSIAVPGNYSRDRAMEPVPPVTRGIVEAIMNRRPLPDAVVRLMDDYIHDSRAGFGTLKEPRDITGGYLRYRRLF